MVIVLGSSIASSITSPIFEVFLGGIPSSGADADTIFPSLIST
jgi:hypothetical protein